MMVNINFMMFFFSLVFTSFFFFFFSIYFYLFNSFILMEWVIMNFNSMKFSFIIYLDFMSMMYLSTVLMITGIVMMYSVDYMMNDLYINRFKFMVFLFMLSMCLMILSPGILSILLGWDGLGLISYCLVIYYQNKNSYNSGMLTVCCNRLGDIALILMICMMTFFGSWNLFLYNEKFILCMFLILMMITKSAQFPFSSWLPAAMTAPTPVSSLVHSSTLVTAGVYLLIRYNKMFIDLNLNKYMLMIFSLTMLMSGIMANLEMNLKKIIALSTLSQLGFMMSILSIGCINLGFYHLIIHAFFKSMMFMSVGGLIHMNLNIQDLRMYGNLFYMNPMKSMLLILSIFNLCGFPFMSGFFSKDLILEGMFNINFNMFNLIILYISIMLTLSYSIRLLYYVLFFNKNFYSMLMLGEFYNYMNFIFFFLMFFSVFFGKYFNMMFVINKFKMSMLDKILLFKMYLFGFYLVYMFIMLNLLKYNSLLKFIMSMLYLIFFFKVIYVKLFNFIMKYEIMFEKNIDKIMSLNLYFLFFYFNKVLNMKLLKFNFNFMLILNFYVFLLFLFFMI